jgi:hypothetical protein
MIVRHLEKEKQTKVSNLSLKKDIKKTMEDDAYWYIRYIYADAVCVVAAWIWLALLAGAVAVWSLVR